MPNPANIRRPVILIGAGRTSSSYVQDRLRHGLGTYYTTIENNVYRDLHKVLTESGWCFRYKYVGKPAIVEERVAQAIRDVLSGIFVSDLPEWSMKCIWSGHDRNLLEALFPEARYLHLVRDPRTNIPSMLERLDYSREYACKTYIESNQNALEFTACGDRYQLIRQEDFVDDREATWQRVCTFLGEEFVPGVWDRELNASKSTEGKVNSKRAHDRWSWSDLPADVITMAETLGYTA